MQNVLIVLTRPKLGDFLMATPLLRGLRTAFPKIHLTGLLWPPDAGEWLTAHPLLDAIIYDDPKGAEGGITGSLRLLRRLKSEQFEAAIDLRDRARYAWLFKLAGIPLRIGSTSRLHGLLLTHNLRQDRDHPQLHEIEYNYDLGRSLGVTGEPGPMEISCSPEAEESAKSLMRLAGGRLSEPFLVVNPTHGGSSRSWPAEKFLEASVQIAQAHNLQIVLTGGMEQKVEHSSLARSVKHPIIDLTGVTSVLELAALFKYCRLHLSVDTGTMHLAAAMRTPCVTVFPFFEHWDQRVRWRPWQTKYQMVGPAVRCSNCRPGRCARTQSACIESITVEAVAAAAEELLSSLSLAE